MGYYVHESSYVDQNCYFGENIKIWHFSHVMKNTTIGENSSLGQNVFVGENVKIGSNVKIQNNVSIYEGVIIEDEVFLGPSCVFTNIINPRAFIERKSEYKPTIVRRGASIGANATIVCGCEIGEFAMVGAGAVVTKNIPKHALVYGNPAKVHGYVCKCGAKLKTLLNTALCSACELRYIYSSNTGIQ